MNILFVFLLSLVIAALVQVTILALPLGVLLILVWYLTKGTKNLEISVVIFSISLAVVANIPIWVIFTATTASLYLFILSRFFLPSKIGINAILFGASLVLWEVSVVFLAKVANI